MVEHAALLLCLTIRRIDCFPRLETSLSFFSFALSWTPLTKDVIAIAIAVA
jgi:hypothetical protein